MPKYGLISELDGKTIEKTFDLIFKEFPEDTIHCTEIGLFDGQTARGIKEYLDQNNKTYCYTGIDNQKDKPIERPFESCNLIIGNSSEVYHQLEDNSQHFIFIDGCHSFPSVIADFFCYAQKVKKGGFLALHDTGKHILPFKDYQGYGSMTDPDMYISVRRALETIGMFKDAGYDLFPNGTVSPRYLGNYGFRMVFDEADETDLAGGITVYQKKIN